MPSTTRPPAALRLVTLGLLLAPGPAVAQASPSPEPPEPPEPTWTVGPTLGAGPRLPRILGDLVPLAIGARGAWTPPALPSWLRLEGEGLIVTGGSAEPDVVEAPLPPGEWFHRDEHDVGPPFVAVTARLAVEIPFGPGDLRAHGGGGAISDRLEPVVTRGLGWTGRLGSSARISLDWERWSLQAGGDRIRIGLFDGGVQREVLGRWEDGAELDLFRLTLSWTVAR